MTSKLRPLLSIPQVAKMLGISRTSVYDLISVERLTVVDLRSTAGGRSRVRLYEDEVAALVERRTHRAKPAA